MPKLMHRVTRRGHEYYLGDLTVGYDSYRKRYWGTYYVHESSSFVYKERMDSIRAKALYEDLSQEYRTSEDKKTK